MVIQLINMDNPPQDLILIFINAALSLFRPTSYHVSHGLG